MIPAAFGYERAESVEHALELLTLHGPDAKLLAGGHSLLPLMKRRRASPRVLIDVGRVNAMAYVREDGEAICIGALTTHSQLANDPLLAGACGLVGRAAAAIADVQIRNRGTLGGAVADADPAADLPTALAAVEATMVLRGPTGERRVVASQFFRATGGSVLGPDEILTEIRVPALTGWSWHYEKFVTRSTDWAIVASAVAIRSDDGTVTGARVGLCNMGSTPLRAHSVEVALAGASVHDEGAIADAARRAAEDTDPPTDLHASASYRRHLATVLTSRAIRQAARSGAA